MVSVEEAVIARLDRGGVHFEVLVDPIQAQLVRKGEEVSVDKLAACVQVFTDCRKGLLAKESDVRKILGVSPQEAIYKIVREGQMQVTTKQRREELERRKREIAALIAKNAVDPRTKAPHPADRILTAMAEARVRVDERPANEQVQDVISALQSVLPLSVQQIKLLIKVPAKFTGKVYGRLKSLGEMLSVKWQEDGTLVAKVQVPASAEAKFYDVINSLTGGEVVIEKE